MSSDLMSPDPVISETTDNKSAERKGATYCVNGAGWGPCARRRVYRGERLPGPIGACGRDIGTIGYRLAGEVVCFGCFTRQMV